MFANALAAVFYLLREHFIYHPCLSQGRTFIIGHPSFRGQEPLVQTAGPVRRSRATRFSCPCKGTFAFLQNTVTGTRPCTAFCWHPEFPVSQKSVDRKRRTSSRAPAGHSVVDGVLQEAEPVARRRGKRLAQQTGMPASGGGTVRPSRRGIPQKTSARIGLCSPMRAEIDFRPEGLRRRAYSLIAAMPGSSLPSRASSIAPPPVDT